MKTGYLVVARDSHPDEGEMGIVIGFDKDNDPVLYWQFKGLEEPSYIGTYRSQIEVANELQR